MGKYSNASKKLCIINILIFFRKRIMKIEYKFVHSNFNKILRSVL